MRAALASAGLAALLALGGASACGPDAPQRRHVLLLTIDTLRPDYLSHRGYDLASSPFLDALCARGLVFTDAVAPIARTTQALASLFTGVPPQAHGVRRLFDTLPAGLPTLAEIARARGYATVAVVSNLILQRERGLDRGFDVYDVAPAQRAAQATTDAALARLLAIDPDEAVFLWVHYIDPHVPYYPPADLARAFDPGYQGPYALHFGEAPDGVGGRAYPADLGKPRAIFRNPLSERVNAHVRRLYAAEIRATDAAVERLVGGLERRFGRDWTIVFTADHGESLGEGGYYWEHGDFVSAAELRVPLALVLPADDPLHRVGRVDGWVSLLDLFPTLVELLGAAPPHPPGLGDGRSLVPALAGRALEPRPVFAESDTSFFPAEVRGRRFDFNLSGRLRAVLDGRFKLVWTPGGEPAWTLYDVTADPGETRDLYSAGHPEARRLAALLDAWLRRAPEAPNLSDTGDLGRPGGPDADGAQRLRALGYLE
jgi:arylsulfatase A-like enzyme